MVGLWRETGLHFFLFCRRLRASAQGVVVDGLARCWRLRLSNSLRCARLSGIASESAAILSQISSSSSSRCFTLSVRISSIRTAMSHFLSLRNNRPRITRITRIPIAHLLLGCLTHWRKADSTVFCPSVMLRSVKVLNMSLVRIGKDRLEGIS